MKSILRKHFNKNILHIAFFAMCFTALWLGSNMTASAANNAYKLDDDTLFIKIDEDTGIFMGYDTSSPKMYVLFSSDSVSKKFDATAALKPYISLDSDLYELTKIEIDATGCEFNTNIYDFCSETSEYITYNNRNHRHGNADSGTAVICQVHNGSQLVKGYYDRFTITPAKINITVKPENNNDIASTIIKYDNDKSFDLGVNSDGSIQILSKNSITKNTSKPLRREASSGGDLVNISSDIPYLANATAVDAVATADSASRLNINTKKIKLEMWGDGTNKTVYLHRTSLLGGSYSNINTTLDADYQYITPAKLTVTEKSDAISMNGSAAFKNGSFIVDNVSSSHTQTITVPAKTDFLKYDIANIKGMVSNSKINITAQTTIDAFGEYIKSKVPSNALGLNYADTYFLVDNVGQAVRVFFDVNNGSLSNFRMSVTSSSSANLSNVSFGKNNAQTINNTYNKYKDLNDNAAGLGGSSYEVSYVMQTSATAGQMSYYNLKNAKDDSPIKLLIVNVPNGYLDYIKLDGKLTKFEGSVPDTTLKEAFMNKAIQTVDATNNNVYSYIHYTYEPVALTINDKAVNIANSGAKTYFYNKNKVYVESNDYEFLYEKTETKAEHEGKEVTQTTEGIYEIDGSNKNKAESFELKVKNSITGEEITVSYKPSVEITAVKIGNYQTTETEDDSLTWLEYSADGVVLGMYADSSNIDTAKAVFNESYDLDSFKSHVSDEGSIIIDDDGNIETDFSKNYLESFTHYFVLSGDYGDYSHTNTLSMNYTLAGLKKYATAVESTTNGSITTYTFTYPSVFGLSYVVSVDESGNITKLLETSGGETQEIDLSSGSISNAETVEKTEGGMKGNESAKSESSTTKKNEQIVPETTKTTKHTITVHVIMNGKESVFTVSVDDASALPSVKTLAAKKYNLDAGVLEITTKDLPKLIYSDLNVYVKATVPETTSDEKEDEESGKNNNSNEDVIISFVDADGTIVKTTVVKSGTNVSKLAPEGYDWDLTENTVAYHDMTIYAGKIAASKLDKSYNTKNDY